MPSPGHAHPEPLVSILIAVYNTAEHLRECLDSVLAQSYRNLDVVCVDDASTDGSAAILAEYAARDKRFRVVAHPDNRGLPAARNTAVAAARGDYLRHLDSDDIIPWRSTDDLVRAAIAHGSQVVVGNAARLVDGRVRQDSWLHRFEVDRYDFVLADEPILWCNFSGVVYYLFDASFLRRTGRTFAEDLHYGEDQAFVSGILAEAEHISAIANVIYFYRLTRGSMSQDFTISNMDDELCWPLVVRENLRDLPDAYVHTLVRSTKNRFKILKYAARYHDEEFVLDLIGRTRSLWEGVPLPRLFQEDLRPLAAYLSGEVFPLLVLLKSGEDEEFLELLAGRSHGVPAWVTTPVL